MKRQIKVFDFWQEIMIARVKTFLSNPSLLWNHEMQNQYADVVCLTRVSVTVHQRAWQCCSGEQFGGSCDVDRLPSNKSIGLTVK
jgi:hypothetical protein